jgi:hypothetical protein
MLGQLENDAKILHRCNCNKQFSSVPNFGCHRISSNRLFVNHHNKIGGFATITTIDWNKMFCYSVSTITNQAVYIR